MSTAQAMGLFGPLEELEPTPVQLTRPEWEQAKVFEHGALTSARAFLALVDSGQASGTAEGSHAAYAILGSLLDLGILETTGQVVRYESGRLSAILRLTKLGRAALEQEPTAS